MPSPQFVARVRTELLRALTRTPAAPSGAPPSPASVEFAPDEAVAFVDYENFFHVLKRGFGVEPQALDMPNLIRELAQINGLNLKGQHYFCGLPDRRRDNVRHEARRKRIAWLEKSGALVTALPLTYFAEGGESNLAREKGVDVALTSEMLRCVSAGLQNVVVFTNDRDIAASISSGEKMAAANGRKLMMYSVACDLASSSVAPGVGLDGLVGTRRISLSSILVAKHLDQRRHGEGKR